MMSPTMPSAAVAGGGGIGVTEEGTGGNESAKGSAVPISTASADLSAADSVISARTGKPKRRKAARACLHCQRTHLTCDNNRPCERCVLRGLADTCEDGIRKKAKYLTEDDEVDISPVASSSSGHMRSAMADVRQQTMPDSRIVPHNPPISRYPMRLGLEESMDSQRVPMVITGPETIAPSFLINDDGGLLKAGTKFQSSVTDLEYSTLSSLLRDTHVRPPHSEGSESSPAFSEDSYMSNRSFAQTGHMTNHVSQFSLDAVNLNEVIAYVDQISPSEDWTGQPRRPPVSLTVAAEPRIDWEDGTFRVPGPGPLNGSKLHIAGVLKSDIDGENTAHAAGIGMNSICNSPSAITSATAGGMNTAATNHIQGMNMFGKSIEIPLNSAAGAYRTPYDVYSSVRQPFPYTPGFHALVKYIKGRFRKPQLMEIVRSMAKYRPSFIAYSNALTNADLVFLEQCFQRSLLEYEKYFRFYGTPSCIWRRTGQIAAVGLEFTMLTGWRSESLLANPTLNQPGKFIIELMDDRSVVEYFRLFSILFSDSRGMVMTDCTLITPDGRSIRTSSVLTLKRDIFGIPMLVIGNFLPVLTSA